MEELRPGNRLFVALDLPGEALDALERVGREAASRDPGMRAVPRENMHLTLDFLGRVPPETGPALAEAVAAALAGPPLRAGLGDPRARPRGSRARLVAVEIRDPGGAIAERAGAVRAAVDRVLGRPGGAPPLWPHVTVARRRRAGRVAPPGAPDTERLFDVGRGALYDSEQSPHGPPRYRALAAIDLAPAP